MRKQIAAANWKMNLTYQQAEKLLNGLLAEPIEMKNNNAVIFAVPFPYLTMAKSEVDEIPGYYIAAQNCSNKKSGAFTGEVSAEMIQSIGINYCIVGHSERRELFGDTNQIVAEKVSICLQNRITPIFCCGEALSVREENNQNDFVQKQLEESFFHLSAEEVVQTIIAYEPVWAIGTGKTATTAQAQEMHLHIRTALAAKYGQNIADQVSILYGGSVKASNAQEIFNAPDVDGGLVGGASLQVDEFLQIIKALK